MIKIGHRFKVESDAMNIILSKKVTRTRKDTGEKYIDWEVVGYFSTPKGLLHELVNQGIRDTQLKDLKTIVNKLDELHALIDNLNPQVLKETIKT